MYKRRTWAITVRGDRPSVGLSGRRCQSQENTEESGRLKVRVGLELGSDLDDERGSQDA